MTNYLISIEVPEGKVKEILDRLTEAQEIIYQCYSDLKDIGVLVVREKATSGN